MDDLLSDDEVFGSQEAAPEDAYAYEPPTQQRQDLLSDDDVFGTAPQGGGSQLLSDDEVFGGAPARPERPEAESAPDTFWREARHAVLPAVGALPAMGYGAAAGAGLGALAGPAAPLTVPAGAILGGAAGALGAGYILSSIQEWALKKLGLSDVEQRAVNEEANPGSAFAGQVLTGAAVGFNPGKLAMSLMQRGVGAGLQGGLEAGTELAQEGHVTPWKVLGAGAAGAVFANPNALGRAGMGAGERAFERTTARFRPGRPDEAPTPTSGAEKAEAETSTPPTVARGVAQEQPAPPKEATTVGNPDSAAVRSDRQYPKERPADPDAARQQELADAMGLSERPEPLGYEHLDPSNPVPEDVRFALNPQEYPHANNAPVPMHERVQRAAEQGRRQELDTTDPRNAADPNDYVPQSDPVRTGLAEVAQARGQTRPEIVQHAIDMARKTEGHENIARALEVSKPAEAMQQAQQYIKWAMRHADETRPVGPDESRALYPDRPKPVQEATAQMRAKGREAEAVALEMQPDRAGAKLATGYLRGEEHIGQEYVKARVPTKAPEIAAPEGGKNVSARDLADQAAKAKKLGAAQKAFDEFGPLESKPNPNGGPPLHGEVPTTKEEIDGLRERVTAAVNRAKELNDGKDPTGPKRDGGYQPRVKPASYQWLNAAKKLLKSRFQPKDIADFIANEKMIRAGHYEEVRGTTRINADIERAQRPTAEEAHEQGRIFPGETPHEEAEALVKPEPVTKIEDAPTRELDMSKMTPEELERVGAEMAGVESEAPEKWKQVLEEQTKGIESNLQRLRELRANRDKDLPPPQDVLKAFLADETGGLRLPNWFGANRQQVVKAVEPFIDRVAAPKFSSIKGTDYVAHSADRLFGGEKNNPARKFLDGWHEMEVNANDRSEAGGKFVEDGIRLQDKDPANWDKMQELMFNETKYQVYADKPPTMKDQGFRISEWGRANHAALDAEYQALPQEFKDFRQRWYDMAKDTHNEMAQLHGENRLRNLLDAEDPGFVKRVLDGTETASDIQNYSQDVINIIRNSSPEKLAGPYTHQFRRGKWMVYGVYDVAPPPKFDKQINENTWRFDNKADSDAFMQNSKTQPTERTYHVDSAGDEFDAKGNRYVKGDTDATGAAVTPRWEVSIQNKHLEFKATEREAIARGIEMRESKEFKPDSLDIQLRKFAPGTNAVAMAESIGFKALENSASFKKLNSKQQEEVKLALSEQYLDLLASSRGGSTRARRTNVPGYERDFLNSTAAFFQETSHRLAQLKFKPQMEQALKEFDASINTANGGLATTNAKRVVLNELQKRFDAMSNDYNNLTATAVGRAIHRVLATSSIARLATAGYSIRNLTQGITHGMTNLAGHFKAEAGPAMMKVYNEIGSASIIKEGLKNTWRAAKGDKPSTLLDDIKTRLDPFGREVVEYLRKNGSVDGEAGFMVHKFLNSGDVKLDIGKKHNILVDYAEKGLTKADRALEWMDELSRQLPKAVEMVNRVPLGVAAARLHYAKHGDKPAAMRFAKDLVDQTQFRYSDSNKPPAQTHVIGRLPLQFKQFGISTYSLLGHNIGKVIKNQEAGDRAAGIRALAGMAVATTAFAGILGLPTEPFRMLLLGAKAAGFTDKDWDDVELKVREYTRAIAGRTGGEALSKGLPRLLNMDLSTGLGMDNLLFFGSPRSGSDRDFDNNLQSWIGQLLIGAPGTMAIQMFRGMRELGKGEYLKAAQDLIPIKQVSDVARAGRQYVEGTKTPSGRQTSAPYSVTEAATRALGIPPGREQEEGSFRRYAMQHEISERDRRGRYINAYINAKTPEERTTALAEAAKNGIRPRDLVEARNRRRSAERNEMNGAVVGRRNREAVDRMRDTMNLPPDWRRQQREN